MKLLPQIWQFNVFFSYVYVLIQRRFVIAAFTTVAADVTLKLRGQVNHLVFLDVGMRGEALPTNITQVRLFTSVTALMYLKGCWTGKTFTTSITNIQFLPCVRQLVSFEIACVTEHMPFEPSCIREMFATNITGVPVVSLPGMDDGHMTFESTCTPEAFATWITDRLLSSVGGFMSFKRAWEMETLAAYITD